MNSKNKANKKLIIILIITAAVCVVAAVTVFLITRGSSYVPSVPAYGIAPMSAQMRDNVTAEELARLETFGNDVPADASERHQYDIKLAVNEFTDDYSYAMVSLHETVSFMNTTGETLAEISLRDYAQAWIDEARTYDTYNGIEPFDTDTDIFNVKNAHTGALLTAVRDSEDPSVIYITFDKPLKDGEQAAVSFDFTFPVTQTGLRGTIAEIGKDKYCMELGNFYPILSERKNGEWVNHPDFAGGECFFSTCSDYTVTVSAPEGWTVISTGDEKTVETADGYTIWSCTAENVRDFAMAVSNGYDYVEATTKTGVKTRFWYYKDGTFFCEYGDSGYKQAVDHVYSVPHDYGKITAAALRAAVTSLELYNEKIGKYAYDSMDIIESSQGRDNYSIAGGMEYSQFVTVCENFMTYVNDTQTLDKDDLYRAIVHEIGHNWFYGIVGNDEYFDTWLDEGFTTFLENLFMETALSNGQPSDSGKKNIEKAAKKYKTRIDIPVSGFKSDDEYSCVVYSRAAYFLFELRDAIGEDKFYDMLREYYETYSFREAMTEQFIEIAEKYISDNAAARKLFAKYLSRY